MKHYSIPLGRTGNRLNISIDEDGSWDLCEVNDVSDVLVTAHNFHGSMDHMGGVELPADPERMCLQLGPCSDDWKWRLDLES